MTERRGRGSDERWAEVDRLVDEEKIQAALARTEAVLAAAGEEGDAEFWTEAILRATRYRTALHGHEGAVRALLAADPPDTAKARAALHLLLADSLRWYGLSYGWEVDEREAVLETGDPLDLDLWSRDRIDDEIDAAFAAVWTEREEWGDAPVGALGGLIEANDYPSRIRGTLRDALSYLWVDHLREEAFWTARETNERFRLDRDRLFAADAAALSDVALTGGDDHPLTKIAAILADLEAWHRREGRPEAAFEARRTRLERMWQAFGQTGDRERLRGALQRALDELGRERPWWSWGMATLAEWHQAEEDPAALVRARDLAREGAEAHPASPGAARCRQLVAGLERPEYELEAMAVDGPGHASIRITHRNLPRLWFRAYRIDARRELAHRDDWALLPQWQEAQRLVSQGEPAATWSTELAGTPDLRDRVTDVVPPLAAKGLYVVVASARSDFRERANQLQAVNVTISDLVLLTRARGERWEVTALSGSTGRPRPAVRIEAWRLDWRQGHRLAATAVTDRDGRASLAVGADQQYALLGIHGDDVTLEGQPLFTGRDRQVQQNPISTLVTIDRAVYRPGQTVLWKVVVWGGDRTEGRFTTLPGTTLGVELIDPNGETVAREEVTTNAYGTASGRTMIPTGRLLGAWRMRTSLGGGTALRVEEYKRPTFDVTLEEPSDPVRLNRPATIEGEVRYAFGLPVVGAEVGWQVTRVPEIPAGWWWLPPSARDSQVIATGAARTDADGRFTVAFTPEADEAEASRPGVAYRYVVTVDATAEAGETRSAERHLRVGFVAVELSVASERGFVDPGEPVTLGVTRRALGGAAAPGSVSWSLARLRAPEATLLPSRQPRDAPAGTTAPPRPRWGAGPDAAEILSHWETDGTIAEGRLTVGDGGREELTLDPLPAGAYRLEVTTEDAFGATATARRDLLVAGPGTEALALPVLLRAAEGSVPVGGVARLLVGSGLPDQTLIVEIHRDGAVASRQVLSSEHGLQVLEIPIRPGDRGGFGVTVTGVREHELLTASATIDVPWDDRRLDVRFASFRDRIRPGTTETWSVTVAGADGAPLAAGDAELLALMTDRTLDLFAPWVPPDPLALYPRRAGIAPLRVSLGGAGTVWRGGRDWIDLPDAPHFREDDIAVEDGYGIGGPGRGMVVYSMAPMEMADEGLPAPPPAPAPPGPQVVAVTAEAPRIGDVPDPTPERSPDEVVPRTDFSETALFLPHLVTDAAGSVTLEVRVPDSVTEWRVWVQALTRDLRSGSVEARTRSVKELLVRPYLPRFLREGDRAEIAVAVDNAGEERLEGTLLFELLDPATGASRRADFGLPPSSATPFEVEPGRGTTLVFPVVVPPGVGEVVVRATATAGAFSDGEQRSLPLLPGRVHLVESRFAALRGADRRALSFPTLAAAANDPTLVSDQLVVTLDGQLFTSVLEALPYLVTFPYECTEQTLNRFLSTAIVSEVFAGHPAVAAMARELAGRDTRLPAWEADDPNRRMALVETPWLAASRGGDEDPDDLIRVLDPEIARAHRDAALARLAEAQTSSGGFPWFPGGPPSPWMTLYLLEGFSRALEHGVAVPEEMVEAAWDYAHRYWVDTVVRELIERDAGWETVTYLGYVLSSYPDDAWTGGVFSEDDRERMLAFSFRHWKQHAPLPKIQLALTLARAGRTDDARLVFDSVLDSAKTDPDLGTYWAPEDRAWLWYNDTVETHAFALRAMTELDPDDPRREGLVQWLLLDRKLGHWKSTRATAEAIYALVAHLERAGTLGITEAAAVELGGERHEFTFPPDAAAARRQRVVVPGEEVTPAHAAVAVSKETPGVLFASATWHYSTESPTAAADGDLFRVERTFFRREIGPEGAVLVPLAAGDVLAPGDQVEVHLEIAARHAAEYVHLRDPRGAGFEPESLRSEYRWDLGLVWYESVRDSGTDFFFEALPAGEYVLKHRLRATTGGTFRVGPATLQSMYAPEFAAHSAGAVLEVGR